ncbi:MAG: PTS system mannose/fructose/sorbose family transporter subunit IID [Gemmatimonadota bacterium]
MNIRRRDLTAAWLRTFAVQGSWNYRTLVGTGIGFVSLPLLRKIYAGDAEALRAAVERSLKPFNCHPYLSGMAAAALARVEMEEDLETVERFRIALRGPLGRLGDQLVWAEWRPFCAVVGLLLFLFGVGPLLAAAVFLVAYNLGHVWLRWWGFQVGWKAGLQLGKVLQASWLSVAAGKLRVVNQFLIGMAGPLLATRLIGGPVYAALWPLMVAGGSLALYAYRWPTRGRRLAGVFLLSIPLIWWLT